MLQTLEKLRSFQGTELSVVVVICLLGLFEFKETDHNKQSEMFINMKKCDKALLNILTCDKFDTFSSNFYQHDNFYNLQMSSPGKNDVTYKSVKCVVG